MRNRKPILLLFCLFLFITGQAQVLKTINVTTPGTLSTLLTASELSTVTDLTVTGNIDARDFKTIRDSIPVLQSIDLYSSVIVAYTGNKGTQGNSNVTYPADEIPQNALQDKRDLTRIIIPSNTTSIGNESFSGCIGLTGNLILPSTLTSIGSMAFANCQSLTGDLNIPSSVSYIGTLAFFYCNHLNGVLTLPSVIQKIEDRTFSNCSSLTGALNIPNSVITIGNGAFESCKGFDRLVIPNSVNSIGSSAFYECYGFKGTLTLPSEITVINNDAFFYCSGFTGPLIIPNKTTKVGSGVFWYCSGFTSLTLPQSLTMIDSRAFYYCYGFKRINSYILNPSAVSVSSIEPFNGLNFNNCILHVPVDKKDLYSTIIPWKYFSTIVEGYTTKLTITKPDVVINKKVDGTTNAKINNLGALQGVDADDVGNIAVSAIANYDNANIGKNKQIIVEYTLSGSAKDNYIAPDNDTITNAQIFDHIPLSIFKPDVIINKMVDGSTNAVINKLGTLQGVEVADVGNILVSGIANYNNANVGNNKLIIVEYTLSGSAKDKYFVPQNDTITNAKISDYITLNTLEKPTPGCERDNLDLNYSIKTGTPIQFKISFDIAAKNAGMKDITYSVLPTTATSGILQIYIPAFTVAGNYTGMLKMKNELAVESPDYPFTFTINVSSDNILTKFNDVVLFDNFSNRFTGFQWYKNGVEIAGATKQFYVDPTGLVGSYSLKLTTTDNLTLYSCPSVLNIPASKVKVNISTTPNPIRIQSSCSIQIEGLNNEQLKDGQLSVYNLQGICVYESLAIENVNKLNLAVTGVYIGHLTASGNDYKFKIIVTQ